MVAIHPMREIFNNNKTEAILLVGAEIAFNTIDRKVLLHNTEYLCPQSVFIYNCYVIPARLFIIGGKEIRS